MSGRAIAHAIAVIVALGAIVAGIGGLANGIPAALGVFCLVIGGVLCSLIPLSLKNSRAAWSVIVSILAVWTIGTFFGAASLSKALHIGLGVALLLPLALAIGTIAFVSIRAEYPDD